MEWPWSRPWRLWLGLRRRLGYPDYAYDYGYDYPYDEGYYDNGYDNSYAGAEGTYCQTPIRSCGIPEAATVGTPCGCQNSAGTVWGQVQ